MGSSPDVGGRFGLGKPQQADYFEMQTTAQVQDMKTSLGIVPNTLDVMFTELGGEPWKYKASPSKPEISENVLTAISYPDAAQASKLEKEQFERLLREIPLKLLMELKRENQLPFEERDPLLLLFERILRFAGRALAWLQTMKQAEPEGYVENVGKNRGLAQQILKGWVQIAQETLAELNEKEGIEKSNIEILQPLVQLANVLLEVDESKKEKAAEVLLERVNGWNKLYNQKRIPNVLLNTGALIKTLLPIAASLTMGGAAPGLLAMAFASFESEWSGKEITQLFEQFGHAFSELKLAQQFFLEHMGKWINVLFMGIVSEAAGINVSDKDKEKLEGVRSAASLLASRLVTESEWAAVLSASVCEALKLGEFNRTATESLPLLAMHILLLAGVRGGPSKSTVDPLLKGMGNKVRHGLQVLKEEENDQLSAAIGLAIRQADIALQKESPAGYFEALKNVAMLLHLHLDSLEENSEELLKYIVLILQMCHRLSEQNKMVTVVNQAA